MKKRPASAGFMHPESPSLTETDLRAAFFNRFSEIFPWIFPNTKWDSWECDLLVLDTNLQSTEWEIKISKADFKLDARKWAPDFSGDSASTKTKFQAVQSGERTNFFGYLTPAGLIPVDDIPVFAGLMEYDSVSKQFHLLKGPPLLHADPFSEARLSGAVRSVYERFWSFKNKEISTDSVLNELRSERDKLSRRLDSEIRFRNQNLHLTDGTLRDELKTILFDNSLPETEKLAAIQAILEKTTPF